jgi:hypothetical protein
VVVDVQMKLLIASVVVGPPELPFRPMTLVKTLSLQVLKRLKIVAHPCLSLPPTLKRFWFGSVAGEIAWNFPDVFPTTEIKERNSNHRSNRPASYSALFAFAYSRITAHHQHATFNSSQCARR